MVSPYLSLPDLARIYQVAGSTIRRWAREDQWRRTMTRPVRYALADAQGSYEKRHHGRTMSHLATRYARNSHGA